MEQQQFGQGTMASVPQREMFSPAQLCRLGQETVQDIVSKTQDMFQLLKQMPLPNGTHASINNQEDRKIKLQEALRIIGGLFKRLRKIYEKCCEATAEMEFIQLENLIPLKDEPNKNLSLESDKKNSDIVKRLEDERKIYTEQLKLRNRQLKEVIDRLREIVWEINTMLAMRKP